MTPSSLPPSARNSSASHVCSNAARMWICSESRSQNALLKSPHPQIHARPHVYLIGFSFLSNNIVYRAARKVSQYFCIEAHVYTCVIFCSKLQFLQFRIWLKPSIFVIFFMLPTTFVLKSICAAALRQTIDSDCQLPTIGPLEAVNRPKSIDKLRPIGYLSHDSPWSYKNIGPQLPFL